MDKFVSLLLPILFDSAMLLSAIASVMGLVFGLWMLIHPNSFARFEEFASRSISLRRSLRPLEISRTIDRHFYRHHKFFGLFIILCSGYTIYNTLFSIIPSHLEELIGLQFPSAVAAWFISALNTFLIGGNLFAILIGLVIFTRPSALKNFETQANKWVSFREHTSWMEKNIDFPTNFMHAQPRVLGVILVVSSIYLMSIVSIP